MLQVFFEVSVTALGENLEEKAVSVY